MAIERVGVAGCGIMGSGIAEVAGRAGYDVLVWEIDQDARDSGLRRIEASLRGAVERGKLAVEERDRALSRITLSTEIADLADADIIVEAVIEDAAVKAALFREMEALCAEGTILASNTSSVPITELAAAVRRPGRVVGLHFFNPVPVMPLVEVIRTIETSDETFRRSMDFASSLGKQPVAAQDRSGFIVNLLLVPYMLDAVRQLERGIASIEDLDRAMVLGCGHPMGPLTLLDFVGNDTACRIAEIMYEEYREARYAPPPLLRRLVTMGRYGRKAGKGFYDYSGEVPVPLPI